MHFSVLPVSGEGRCVLSGQNTLRYRTCVRAEKPSPKVEVGKAYNEADGALTDPSAQALTSAEARSAAETDIDAPKKDPMSDVRYAHARLFPVFTTKKVHVAPKICRKWTLTLKTFVALYQACADAQEFKARLRREYVGLGGSANQAMGQNYFLYITLGIGALVLMCAALGYI